MVVTRVGIHLLISTWYSFTHRFGCTHCKHRWDRLFMKSLLQIADCHCVCWYGQHNRGPLHSMDSAKGAAPCWKLCWNLPNYKFMNLFYTPQIVTAFVCTDNITLGYCTRWIRLTKRAAPCWKSSLGGVLGGHVPLLKGHMGRNMATLTSAQKIYVLK